ncbi:putative exocyst complex component Exo70, cullin repeat-like-containing domain superfamily [Helianthus annuus]|nr:putative exocyst complex component Exo70, cullin repeat-like-containing domain superfamily [Helianthus annuus]
MGSPREQHHCRTNYPPVGLHGVRRRQNTYDLRTTRSSRNYPLLTSRRSNPNLHELHNTFRWRVEETQQRNPDRHGSIRRRVSHILITNSTPIETEPITESISLTPRTTPRNSSFHASPENENSGNRRDESISRISSASFTDRNERSVTFASCRSMNSIREQDLLPPESISDLRSIAERMIAAGYFRECVQGLYGSVRKSVVDGSFKKLGVEKLSIGDIQRLDWEAMNAKIGRWIRAAKVCIRCCSLVRRSYADRSSKISDQRAADDACFIETVKSSGKSAVQFR